MQAIGGSSICEMMTRHAPAEAHHRGGCVLGGCHDILEGSGKASDLLLLDDEAGSPLMMFMWGPVTWQSTLWS